MSYRKYKTKAIIIGMRNHGEGSRLVFMLTRDLGLLVARGQSLREQRSKMRYHLQYGQRCAIDLVRGKEFWRLVGGEKEQETVFCPRGIYWFSRCAELVRSLVGFDEHNAELFDVFALGVASLHRYAHTHTRVVDSIGQVFMATLLDELGYWGDEHREMIDIDLEELVRSPEHTPVLFSGYLKKALSQAGIYT
jgi:recombinational DNA repair protein (RecF pathway)